MKVTVSSTTTAEGVLNLAISGRLDAETMGDTWGQVMGKLKHERPPRIVVNASGIEYCDGAGAALFAELSRRAEGQLEVRSLPEEFRPLLRLFEATDLAPLPPDKGKSLVEDVGRGTVKVWKDIKTEIAFIGEFQVAFLWALRNPKKMPWKDTFAIAEAAGANAVPIICLIGFLLGLVLAFQSAMSMRQFGAEIFVADLISISMLKELGPLMTAIVLAGRTGSAFAAEIGTMKVNEEIDALTTMGLDPVRYLAVTRGLAASLMTPILAIFCSLAALVGGALVLLALSIPLVVFVDRVTQAVSLTAFLAGVFKSFVYAGLVSGVGCLRGLQTGTGAKAVGDSTTSAVVSGIVLVAIAAAVFSVIQYSLDI